MRSFRCISFYCNSDDDNYVSMTSPIWSSENQHLYAEHGAERIFMLSDKVSGQCLHLNPFLEKCDGASG